MDRGAFFFINHGISNPFFNFIMPVTGVFLAWWLLDEPVTVKILLALLFITAQMVVLYLDPKRRFLQFPFNKGL